MIKPSALQEFISETISQVIHGVAGAQKLTTELNSRINPKKIDGDGHMKRIAEKRTPIEFDIAVTVTEGTGTTGGISVYGIGASHD